MTWTGTGRQKRAIYLIFAEKILDNFVYIK